MLQAVELFKPDLIICPFLKERIPQSIWKNYICINIHPGIKGESCPSSLDCAVLNNVYEWRVTAMPASDELDAGDIWATSNFKMRHAYKSSIYRHKVAETAVKGILQVVNKYLIK